ncbi:manganese/iron transport system substrate-binding protein [Sphingomonas jejuensis]|uniref:Manganese/iron transport system substrate-binding protein n=1 Tax=Sphingomonas jejuensis TaxID=904715 RepID=A0ABX0XIW7_9SPHN|nr:metal ABC transporter substrate-binding protein [Sphingomonas jejuensis]NJC32691.1 manganese/iron transport system substrate-binding protein [Sphingomonas jejuensis]
MAFDPTERDVVAPAICTRRQLIGGAAIIGLSALAGCGGGGSPGAGDGRLKVVTTFTIIADMARNVAGDAATVESITKPGAEIHNYQPTPGDLVRARDAGLILWNGLNLETWFAQFLDNLGNLPSAVISTGVAPIGIGSGPYRGRPNPHAWMSPQAALTYVDNIAAAMAAADAANAATYRRNAAAYKGRIEAVVAPIRQRLAAVPADRRWLVTSEGAFSYLARDFGLRELFLWPINADQQGTPQQVRAVIDQVRRHRIPAVFSESTISPNPARQVARETGARYGGVLYVDSLSEEGGPVPTYLDLLRTTTDRIAEGLS